MILFDHSVVEEWAERHLGGDRNPRAFCDRRRNWAVHDFLSLEAIKVARDIGGECCWGTVENDTACGHANQAIAIGAGEIERVQIA